jgi:hypothetical protein
MKELFWLLAIDAVIIAVTVAAACVGYVIWRLFIPNHIAIYANLLCSLIAPVIYAAGKYYFKSKVRAQKRNAVYFLLHGVNFIAICAFSVYFYFWFMVNVFNLTY